MSEKKLPDAFKTSHRWATAAEAASRAKRSALDSALAEIQRQRAECDSEEERLTVLLSHLPAVQASKGLTFLEHADGWLVKL